MSRKLVFLGIGVLGLVAAAPHLLFAQTPAPLDTAQIETATGLKGTFNKDENVFKVSKPRTDVKIEVDGWPMPPFMGLTSWAAFTPAHDGQTMLTAALDAGLEVTALHNHFFFDEPKVYFMHIGGMGDAKTLAAGVKAMYGKIDEVRAAQPQPQKMFGGAKIAATSSISPAPLEATLGTKGQGKDGMFKIVIGRTATMHGTQVSKEMGVNTWAGVCRNG
jgi:hypothetical protein